MALNATMRAVMWEGIPYSVTVASLPIPTVQTGTDAVVQVQAAAICGTDLHTYHGVYGSSNAPWSLGHEAMGVISEIGDSVTFLNVGDVVVVPDLMESGHLNLEPQMGEAIGLGTDFGLPGGCQVPSGNENASYPDPTDFLFLSDIFATGWTALDYAGFEPGDTVAVFGAGPVGLLSAYSAILRGASRVYSIDHVESRLQMAASIGAIPINFVETDPVQEILRLEPSGVRRAVDCVGFEAVNADLELQENIIVHQMVAVTGFRGGVGQVGVWDSAGNTTGTPYAATLSPNITFPMSDFFNKGLQFQAGPVDPKVVAPHLVELISNGVAHPSFIISSEISIEDVPEYYSRFDQHLETKVVIRFP
ncbi:hypothetical protein BDY21DRAFT_302815 [Lineolata rhizophorae]|uniref:Uncharacterized protein n=1 Tax=Lineolata rhizophorae TaxID=578093 RepID=A0A6A6P1X1_9PEZI|nr:hypothetical protein BDY21DRAFT_302815 [Lineolata rhizophorae]